MVNKNNREKTFNTFKEAVLRVPNQLMAVAMEIKDENNTTIAEMVFADGSSEKFEWTNIEERNKHIGMINGYTLIYDRREKKAFESWKKS